MRAARYRGLWIGFIITALVAFVVICDDYLAVTSHINGLNAKLTDAVAALKQLPDDVRDLP